MVTRLHSSRRCILQKALTYFPGLPHALERILWELLEEEARTLFAPLDQLPLLFPTGHLVASCTTHEDKKNKQHDGPESHMQEGHQPYTIEHTLIGLNTSS